MASTTSSHYIRTIHTSFTAAHSNPWARTTTSSAMPQLYNSQKYPTAPSTPQTPSNGPAVGGRRRAYAFRVAPASRPASSAPSKAYKFDPFADEPTSPVPSIAHLAALSTPQQQQPPTTPRLAAASLPPSQHSYQLQQQRAFHQQHAQSFHSPPPVRRSFTPNARRYHQQQVHQPAQHQHQHQQGYAQQQRRAGYENDIWRSGYTASPIPRGRTLTYEFEEYSDSPASNEVRGIERIAPPRIQRPAPPPTPIVARSSAPAPTRVASPAPARATALTPAAKPFVADKDAKAKLVAGILLNRALHAAGRRGRRVPSPVGGKKPYVPSGLSRVVSVDA